ncbi:MAG: phosphonate transport system permease protein [Akkermansiaceae bacterium]|jgi:phosphonate transport system permease protein
MKSGAWRMWFGRRWLLVGVVLIFAWCVGRLGTEVFSHTAGSDPLASTLRFFGAAFSPSFTDQNPNLPENATPFLTRLGGDLLRTLRYALIATSMAIPAGLLLGFFASKQWWPIGRARFLFQLVRWPVRVFLSLIRSIHELIWAIFFLSAFGDFPLTACLALALPFTGTLAKVFSEIMDEERNSARQVIMASGGSGAQGFFGAVLPAALPDMITYSLYRFECALRSSAVLGFIGIETIGLSIMQSFESTYYGEVWTALYVLIITILLIEGFGYFIRKRLSAGVARRDAVKGEVTEEKLRKTAPKDRTLRFSGLLWAVAIVVAFQTGDRLIKPMAEGQQEARLSRFWTKISPDPIAPEKAVSTWDERKEVWNAGSDQLLPWVQDIWESPGAEALANTVAMSVAAIILAGVVALVLVPFSLRTLSSRFPLGLETPGGRMIRVLGVVVRGGFVVTRAVPEYLYAFLLVGLMGPSAWPLVFALVLHNVGILGRLWTEVGENQPPQNARAVIQVGGGRLQAFYAALLPLSLNRFLLFFFYRWESCMREATVLGMLGFSSLGYYISIRKSFREYDEILFFSLLGASVIIVGDIVSDALRKQLRSA